MRHRSPALAIAAWIAVASAFGSAPAFSQSNPSVDQIIRALTPVGDVSKSATRGIRMAPSTEQRAAASSTIPASAQAAATPAKPVAPAAQPAAQPAAPTINLTVNFATGSVELTPQAVRTLDSLGAALSSEALAGYRFRVEGHTDTVGTDEFNRNLSERRAETVVAYIASRFHVAGTRLEAVGMGKGRLLVQTADQVDEPRNRRVQVTNLGG